MPASSTRQNQQPLSPLDRLIHLIAEIEVTRYVKEVEELANRGGSEHDSSDLRAL